MEKTKKIAYGCLTKKDFDNIDSFNFSCALGAYDPDSYYQYEETEFWLNSPKEENIFNSISKRYSFKELSKEAQEVIKIVLECPKELLEFAITPKRNFWSFRGVQKFIKNKYGRKRTKQILPEIHNFLIEGIQRE